MKLKDLIIKNRSFRRFNETHSINLKTLESLVDLARLSASTANRQPLKYLLINTPDGCNKVFPSLLWAGYLKDWPGPVNGERPSAYIVILGDKSISETFGVDHGIAAQSILLGATESGLGGCIIASIKREEFRDELKIPDNYEILLVLALGEPVENVVLDQIKDGDIKYWRDSEGNHHVPKRSLTDLIVKI
jgi:nitroreductase